MGAVQFDCLSTSIPSRTQSERSLFKNVSDSLSISHVDWRSDTIDQQKPIPICLSTGAEHLLVGPAGAPATHILEIRRKVLALVLSTNPEYHCAIGMVQQQSLQIGVVEYALRSGGQLEEVTEGYSSSGEIEHISPNSNVVQWSLAFLARPRMSEDGEMGAYREVGATVLERATCIKHKSTGITVFFLATFGD